MQYEGKWMNLHSSDAFAVRVTEESQVCVWLHLAYYYPHTKLGHIMQCHHVLLFRSAPSACPCFEFSFVSPVLSLLFLSFLFVLFLFFSALLPLSSLLPLPGPW